MNIIKCQKCGTDIEIDKAIEGQIESRILTQINERHRQELLKVKSETEETMKRLSEEEINLRLEQYKQKSDLETERLRLQLEREAEENKHKKELLIERLSKEAEYSKKANTELRTELKKLTESLLQERKARESAELDADKKLINETSRIKEEARRQADESHRLKELELQKQLNDTKKALDEAQRKAEQGSQQNQGEVLELETEALLRCEFPLDAIEEVKKGQRGADIKQFVKNNRGDECGILLWELKNANWQKEWIAKLKENIVSANAAFGIIVSSKMPENYGDMHNIESNIWAVTPRLALALASALRSTIIQVYTANRLSVNKDEKMEQLYRYLVGTEFSNRIKAIVDNYKILQDEIEKERRAANLRWSKQEKAIRSVIDNTFGFYGDIQGLTGNELKESLLLGTEK